MERHGAAHRITQKLPGWTPSPGNVSTAQGVVTSRAERGGDGSTFLLESIHSRTGAHHASVEHDMRSRGRIDTDVYSAGPFRTQHRSEVAAESLTKRVQRGKGDEYRTGSSTDYGR